MAACNRWSGTAFSKLDAKWENPILENYFQAHDASVNSISFSSTGKQLASGGEDGVFKIWNLKQTTRVYIFNDGPCPINCVCFSPDGNSVASVAESTVQFRTPHMQTSAWTFRPHTMPVRRLDVSRDSRRLVTCSQDRTVKLWNIERQCSQFLQTFDGHKRWANWVCFSSDDKRVASSSDDGSVKIWDPNSRRCVATYCHSRFDPVLCVKFVPNDYFVVSCGKDIRVWDIRKGEAVSSFSEHAGSVVTVDCHPGGDLFCSGSVDGTVKVYNLAESRIIYTLHGHQSPISAVQFTAAGDYVGSADKSGRIFLWRTNFK